MDVLGIDNLMITVPDLDAAKEFYGAVLGLPEKFTFPGIVGFRIGAEEPGLVVREGAAEQPSGNPRLWLEVPDARAVAEELAADGVEILAEPLQLRTGWLVEVADPFGNVIGLTDYTAAPERARSR